ncbi:MAG: AIPR family protein [Bacteroidales bacterium]|nr:AIPR family protein [Bacteroidales bacterium]
MKPDEEQFDDFKVAEEASEMMNMVVNNIVAKELTEVEQYKEEVLDETLDMADDPQSELTQLVVGYIQAMGDVDQVNICSYDNGNGVALDGWGFNGDEDLVSIDLFLSIYKSPEEGKRISANELDRHFNWLYRFYEQSQNGKILGKIHDTKSELYQVADLIHSTEKIDRIRLFLLTNAIAPANYEKESAELEEGTQCEYIIWDAKRVMRQNNIISGKDPIVVDFDADYNSPLPCIQMPDVSECVSCYLCVIPGTVLSQIYHKYHQQILEQNVRTFLQFKGASNKGIRDTMIGHKATYREKLKGIADSDPEPDMFFAYNNGISTTAADITIRKSENGMEITRIKDWQIVNGGQTTASISTVMKMKGVNITQLSKIFVAMKVSVIKDKDKQGAIVQKISRYANTQSAVKKSDFNINEPFLVDIENQSRQEWTTTPTGKPVSKWFFERTRGQYLDKAKRNNSAAAEREFYAEYPKNQMFDKPLLSKFMMAWMENPASVCKGGENNYAVFFNRTKTLGLKFDANMYHRTIAKAILFKAIDALYGKDGIALPGYKSNMVAYTLSALSFLSGKKLDLISLWNEQNVMNQSVQNNMTIDLYSVYAKLINGHRHISYKVKEQYTTTEGKKRNRFVSIDIPKEELDKLKQTTLYKVLEFVKKIEPIIWDHIVNVDEGTNINEWTKSPRCWDALKTKLNNQSSTTALPKDILSNSSDQETEVNEAQQNVIAQAGGIEAETWFSINKWGKENDGLTPVEVSFIGNFAYMMKRGRPYTYKQARWALSLYEKAKNFGWSE